MDDIDSKLLLEILFGLRRTATATTTIATTVVYHLTHLHGE